MPAKPKLTKAVLDAAYEQLKDEWRNAPVWLDPKMVRQAFAKKRQPARKEDR